MATIPSKPLGEFIAYPDRYDEPADVVCFDNMMAISATTAQGFIYITREQAMAFFDLVPSEPHDATDDNCRCLACYQHSRTLCNRCNKPNAECICDVTFSH